MFLCILITGCSSGIGAALARNGRAQAGQVGATAAEDFVVPVVDALLSDPPPVVIRGGHNSTKLPLLKKLLPTRLFDAQLSKAFGIDRFKP